MPNTPTKQRNRTPVALEEKARMVFYANREMNKRTREHNDLRKQLLEQMEKAGVKNFRTNLDSRTNLDVTVATPIQEVISVKKLRDLVDDETFMKIVSATKKDVEFHVGTAVAVNAKVTRNGTTNVFVKEVK